MSDKNVEKSQRNLSNPLSFSTDKTSLNSTKSHQLQEKNPKEKVKIRKFTKQLSSSILNTNDLLLHLKKNSSNEHFKELQKPGVKLVYYNLASNNNNHHQISSSHPNTFQEKKPSQHPQINININNINIDNYQLDYNYDNGHKFPNIYMPKSHTPSTQNRRQLNIKLQSKTKNAIEYQKDHKHNSLLGIQASHLLNDRVASHLSQQHKGLLPAKVKQKKIDDLKDNNESFINELEELLKNVNGKHPFMPISNNPQDDLFNSDIEPIARKSNQINKRSNKELYNQTANSCCTERPQTSYGGVLMRRLKFKNTFRENSEKHNNNGKGNKDIDNDNDYR